MGVLNVSIVICLVILPVIIPTYQKNIELEQPTKTLHKRINKEAIEGESLDVMVKSSEQSMVLVVNAFVASLLETCLGN